MLHALRHHGESILIVLAQKNCLEASVHFACGIGTEETAKHFNVNRICLYCMFLFQKLSLCVGAVGMLP